MRFKFATRCLFSGIHPLAIGLSKHSIKINVLKVATGSRQRWWDAAGGGGGGGKDAGTEADSPRAGHV